MDNKEIIEENFNIEEWKNNTEDLTQDTPIKEEKKENLFIFVVRKIFYYIGEFINISILTWLFVSVLFWIIEKLFHIEIKITTYVTTYFVLVTVFLFNTIGFIKRRTEHIRLVLKSKIMSLERKGIKE